ncbi:hypothetical protein ABPG75_009158 [Micractinium tetrahymenae]
MAAHILRGYGLAREGAHFKFEQEADLQRHRKRLEKEGKLPEQPEAAAGEAGAAAARHASKGFQASEHNYETLAEVLQQQARIDDPNALRRKQYERRIKGEPPPLSEAELMRARSKLHALGAAVGHVPGRISMGRTRWEVLQQGGGGGGDLAAGVRQLSPEAREVASRTYVAGVRALVYGSLLGALGLAAAASYAIKAADIRSGEDLGERMREGLTPLSATLRGWLVPVKERAQAWLGPAQQAGPAADGSGSAGGEGAASGLLGEGGSGGSGGGAGQPSGVAAEFSRKLQEKLHTRRAGSDAADA